MLDFERNSVDGKNKTLILTHCSDATYNINKGKSNLATGSIAHHN